MSEPQKTIGGRRFQFGTLPAETAFDVFATVIKNLGEPLAKLLSGGIGASQEATGMALIGLVAKNMNAAELKGAIKSLLEVTACLDQQGGGKCEMNRTFQGRILDMLQVAVEAFKVNFVDFLAVIPSASSGESTGG